MSTGVLLPLVAVALAAFVYGRRARFPRAELAALTSFAILVWVGVADDRAALVLVAGFIPLPFMGFNVPFISDGGGRRSEDLPRIAGAAVEVGEPARYVTGALASRWPRGELKLTGNLLHFANDEGDDLFRVQVSAIRVLRFSTIGRAQITVRTEDGERHRIAFGRHGLARSDVRTAQKFWRETIDERQANPAS